MSKTLSTFALAAMALSLASTSNVATPATSSFVGYVDKVLVTDDDTFGGCAASFLNATKTGKIWPARLPACRGEYLTFRCKVQEGDPRPHDPLLAYQLLDQAKLAYAADRQVTVYFRDDPAYNQTVCTVYRIELQ